MAYDDIVRDQREINQVLTKIDDNCKLLAHGYTEEVQYRIAVRYHNPDSNCSGGSQCTCPTRNEDRVRSVRRDSLLEQLKQFQQNKDTNRNPNSERQPPRVKKPKMHPELAGFFVLDEISCEVYMVLDRVFEETGRDRTWLSQNIAGCLGGLGYQVRQFVDERPDLARELVKATDKWVHQAKNALNMTVSDAMFGDTVCGNCSGGLAVAWDNSTDVRCVGSPSTPPCGHTYPMTEWLALYEASRRKG